MTEKVPAAQLRAQFPKYVDRAKAGERFIITRGGKPEAMLGPAPKEAPPPATPARRHSGPYNDAAVRDLLSKVNRKTRG